MGILRNRARLGVTVVSGLCLAALASPAAATAPFPIFRSPAGPEAEVRVDPPAGGRGVVVIAVGNQGDAPLTVTPPAASTVAAPISVAPSEPFVVEPGAWGHISITCDPAPAWSVEQTVYFTTNDPIQPVLVYEVTCAGRTPLSELTALVREVPSFNLEPGLEAAVLGALGRARLAVLDADPAGACPLLQ
ncbi:MAG: hypothetical protein ACRDJO_06550, partial [Actinomycetota bacterium]